MKIRPAVSSDMSSIAEIVNWAIENTFAHFHDQPEPEELLQQRFDQFSITYPWLVAVAEKGVVGFAMAGPHKPRAAYDWTTEVTAYVHPANHRQGVGRALYQQLLPTLQLQHFRSLVAVISLPNAASVRLHQSFGFEQYGLLKGAGYKFDAWHDVSYWRRPIFEDDRPPSEHVAAAVAWKKHANIVP